jgi:hypothetical protein
LERNRKRQHAGGRNVAQNSIPRTKSTPAPVTANCCDAVNRQAARGNKVSQMYRGCQCRVRMPGRLPFSPPPLWRAPHD